MQAFMQQLDIDYAYLFTCPLCCARPHDQLTLIVDGKEMGIQRAAMKPYTAPVDYMCEAKEAM